MAVSFEWENRPTIPATPGGATTVTTDVALLALIAARVADDAAEDVILDGTFEPFKIQGYVGVGTGLRFWPNVAGTSKISFQGNAGSANGALVRIQDSANISFYGIEMDGEATFSGGNGSTWGFVAGSSFTADPNRGYAKDILISHCDIHHPKQEPVVFSGDGTANSTNCTIQYSTIHDSGQDTEIAFPTVNGFGEGIYAGDGNGFFPLSNVNVIGNHIYNIKNGECVEMKNDITNATIVGNLIEDSEIHTGGGITLDGTGHYVARNRIHNLTSNPDGPSGSTDGIAAFCENTIIENNVIWDIDGSCIGFVTGNNGGNDAMTVRHNTLDGRNGIACFRWTSTYIGPDSWAVDCDNNVHIGTYNAGALQSGSTQNDHAASTADFVGPTGTGNGTSDAGQGPGSAYELDAGSSAVDDATNIITDDISLYARPFATLSNQGAFEFAGSSVAFAITTPVDLAIDVATPITPSGTAPNDGSQGYQTSAEVDGQSDVWNPVTFTSGTETWVADAPIAIPQAGETIRNRARRWS